MSKRSRGRSRASEPKGSRVVGARKSARRGAKRKAGSRRRKSAPHRAVVAPTGRPVVQATATPIVAIGASAGGLEAFKSFFSNLPADTGLAFVIAQHLTPGHKSGMVDLLRKMTAMEVIEAGEGMPILANRIHMIPPGNLLRIEKGHLRLTPAPKGEHWSPVDHLFRSLALAKGADSIAIEMSGMGSDGTKGMAAIREAGGLVVVQTPESAKSSSMPASVIASGVADIVAPAEEIPALLLERLGRTSDKAADDQNLPSSDEAALREIEKELRQHSGHDFSHYKRGTILRRVKRRMELRHAKSLADYVRGLTNDRDELNQLFGDLLIGVTEFFREPEAWKTLTALAIDPMIRSKRRGEAVRAWVAGCATGQEAYSVGMLLLECAGNVNKELDIKIFASDINEHSLQIARAGTYPAEIESQISASRLERFFVKATKDSYQVNKELRERIIFAQQSLIADAPFSKLDLITCRNVLIYLEPALQRQILKLFHFALGEDGYLFLGNAEATNGFESHFRSMSKKWRIFQKQRTPLGADTELPVVGGGRRKIEPLVRMSGGQSLNRLSTLAQQLVLERFAPASVLINRNFEILYYCGPTHEYLVNPTGIPTHNLLDMARTGLRAKLRALVLKVLKGDRTVSDSGIRLRRGQAYFPVRVTVSPLHEADSGDLLLIVFEERSKGDQAEMIEQEGASDQEESLVRQLEYDLKVTREDLQANLEELETSNEELKAANEEMTSMNEELQSANEELETSKEEMQSLNEELTTVNNQLQVKVEELEAANDDLENLLSSTELATIFLDRDFRIRRFTPPTRRLISLTASDVGRPLTDFAQRVADGDLLKDAQTVLERLEPIEAEVRSEDGRFFLRRILPYRTKDGQVEGVVITFTDITQRKSNEEHQRTLIAELDHRVKNTLAVVQSLASQTIRQSGSLEEFASAFEGRLMAMAKAHALLSQTKWKGAKLRSLVERTLGHYAEPERNRCRFNGDELVVDPRTAMSLTMVLHELTTNAVKHGALSNSSGQVDLNWRLKDEEEGQPMLELRWIESDGPRVQRPGPDGFGTGLIKRCVEYEPEGRAKMEFPPDGFQATLLLPWVDGEGHRRILDPQARQTPNSPQLDRS